LPLFTQPQFKLITEVVQVNPSNQLPVTGLPSTFRHLLFIPSLRSDANVAQHQVWVNFNADLTASYYTANFAQVNSPGSAANDTKAYAGHIPALQAQANEFSTLWMLLPYYAQVGQLRSGFIYGGSPNFVANQSLYSVYNFYWQSSAIVNQVLFTSAFGNLIVGSRVSVYGIK